MANDWRNAPSYKLAKELFVRDLEGSSIWEVLLLYLPLPTGLWLFSEIQAFLEVFGQGRVCGWRRVSIEMVVIVGPCLIAVMPPSPDVGKVVTGALVGVMATTALLLRGVCQGRSDPDLRIKWKREQIETLLPQVPSTDKEEKKEKGSASLAFVDHTRGWTMLGTVIAILAVDFQIFPRSYAKTEVYGTGLMDLGTSAFVFISGLCSVYARRSSSDQHSEKDHKNTTRSVVGAFSLALKKSWVLVILGVSRFFTVKAIDYQEHVTEYGVHWNFFLTLAMVKLWTVLAHSLFSRRFDLLILTAFLVLGGYQVLLTFYGWDDYMVNGARDTLVSMNREGIFGIPGYLCIFFVGELTGKHLVWNVKGRLAKSLVAQWQYKLNLILIYSIIWWLMTFLCIQFVQPVSRRFVNISYVSWSVSMSLTSLWLTLAIATNSSGAAESLMLISMSKNMLVVFFIANVLTGLINLMIKTLYASTFVSIMIVTLYTFLVCLLSILCFKNFQPKKFHVYFE